MISNLEDVLNALDNGMVVMDGLLWRNVRVAWTPNAEGAEVTGLSVLEWRTARGEFAEVSPENYRVRPLVMVDAPPGVRYWVKPGWLWSAPGAPPPVPAGS